MNTSTKTKKLVTIALAAAIMCILGPVSFPLPFSPVPVSLGVFGALIAAYALGAKLGLAACAVYILMGMVGLPVFSGFNGGIGVLAGPTGGYIIGYFFEVFISGLFIEKFENKLYMHLPGMIIGVIILYVLGTLWLASRASLDFGAALMLGVVPYIPADAAKIILALIVGPKIRKAIKRV